MKRGGGLENWRRVLADNSILQHQLLEVSIGGTAPEERAAQFRLRTHAGLHSVSAKLYFPQSSSAGSPGDDITVSLVSGDKTDLYFTGTIYQADVRGAYRELLLTDSYKKLCDTQFIAAYRKEKAANIISDILDAAGISETSVTCPDVELARFSTQEIPARMALDLLIDALKEHGASGLVYFFDEKDTFHFGALSDTGKNEGEAVSFETDKNILRKGPGWIETLPAPVRHSQAVTVDGKELVTAHSDLFVSRSLSRLTLYLRGKEAE
jgi:hypothetical protein